MQALKTPTVAWLLMTVAAASFPSSAAPLTLPELQSRARQNDLRVKAAEADLADLHGKYQEAFWAWFPKFETLVALGGPTPEAHNNGLGGPPSNAASYSWDSNWGVLGVQFRTSMNAFLPVYTFGKLTALREAGEQGVMAGEGLKQGAQDEAAYQTAQAFYAYQLARGGKETLQDTLNNLTDAAKLVDKLLKHDSAQVTAMDRFKLQYYVHSVEARLAQADAGMVIASDALRLLTGTPRSQPMEIVAQDFELFDMDLPAAEVLVDTASHLRPEIRAIRAGVHAKEREVLIKERSFYPDVGILGFAEFAYTTNATRQRTPFAYDPYNVLNAGLAVVIRGTFDIPQKSAQLEQSRAQLQKLEAQRDLVVQGVELQVRKLRADLTEASQRAHSNAEAEHNARKWATAAYANFELGTVDTRELVDAFTALAVASGERLKGCHDVEVGIRELARAVGSDEAVQTVRRSAAAP